MAWVHEHQLAVVGPEDAAATGIQNKPLAELGAPPHGGMIVVRAPGQPPTRWLLK
jgi:hypothetical protein